MRRAAEPRSFDLSFWVCGLLAVCSLSLGAPSTVQAREDEESAEAASSVGEDLRIETLRNQTPVYTQPDEGSAVKMRVKKGRKLVAKGSATGGFFRVVTKSGTALFIREADAKVLGAKLAPEEDLVSGEENHALARHARMATEEGESRPEKWRLTFDLGVSAGSVNNKNYTEGNLGVNLYFTHYLAWRNALFGRFASGLDTTYGVDTSVRGILNVDLGRVGDMVAFAGPGFRFINEGRNAPFGEAGLVFRLLGISIGGGMKRVFQSVVDSRLEDDTQYFIILSGGGSL